MRKWLKWGLVLLVINWIFLVIGIIQSPPINPDYSSDLPPLFLLPAFLITDVLYWGANTFAAIIIVSSIVTFIAGAIIGFVVDKARKK